jgi:hypothetical protein
MHDSDHQSDLPNRRSLLLPLERSLDHLEALQSLELQHLRLAVERSQLVSQQDSSHLPTSVAMHSQRCADTIVRRAA